MSKKPLIPIGTIVLDGDQIHIDEVNGHRESYDFPPYDTSSWQSLKTPQPLYVKALAHGSALFIFGDAQSPTCFLASGGQPVSSATFSELIETFRPV